MLSVSSSNFQHRGTEVQRSQREIFPLLYPLLGRGRGGFCVFPCSLSNVLHNYPSCSSPLDKGVGGWKSYQSATSASYYPHLLLPHMSFPSYLQPQMRQQCLCSLFRGINPTAIRLRPFRAFIYSLLPTPYSLSSPTQGPYTPTKLPTVQG